MKRIVLTALCAIALGCASTPVAQPTLAGPSQNNTVQSYMSKHPLLVSPYTLRAPQLANIPPRLLALLEPQGQRPECPMPVSAPAKINDSMPVSRAPVSHSEAMPVAAPLCVNPLGPQR